MKRPPLYTVPLVVMFVIVLLAQLGAPQQLDWTSSFSRNDKIPYGAYILFDILPKLYPNRPVTALTGAAYNELATRMHTGEAYIAVNNVFSTDDLDTRAILEYARRGNTVFIAAQEFSGPFGDSLNLGVNRGMVPFGDSTSLNLVNPALRAPKDYRYKPYTVDSYFSTFDTAGTVVLGENNDHRPNFIMMKRGKGAIILSSVPFAFTNYNLRTGYNPGYAVKALSYVHATGILWDEHYKAARRESDTPMRYVLDQPSLRWAYYTLLAGVIIYMIFMGRRRQRIIPIIKPLPNTTLDFAQTVAQLYYRNGDHKNIAEKRIVYFLEHIRSTYGLNTNEPSEELFRQIGARSGVDADRVRDIFGYIERMRAADRVDPSQLTALSAAIEHFYAASTRGPVRTSG